MQEPREKSIVDAVAQMRGGKLKSRELVESCLERIHSREETVRAWVEVYEKEALEAARQCDDDLRSGRWRGNLHGIPVGVKDIIDVKDMWTRAGTAVYPPRKPALDAPSVKQLRQAGAIILGKTVTTAFANNDPSVTRNPWNIEHTPGGSSSGSAAAVADRMCLAALGTQTGGSVLRPAAYNGIVGFKPTYASISTRDVLPVSWTLDHVGVHARSVADAEMVYDELRAAQPDLFAHMPPVNGSDVSKTAKDSFCFAYFKTFIETKAEAETVELLGVVREKLEAAGASFVDIEFLDGMSTAAAAHRVIMDSELATAHWSLFEAASDQYPPFVKERIEAGRKTAACDYLAAVRQRIDFQRALFQTIDGLDGVIMPTAPSSAPKGLASTGSPLFCVPWSMSGFPSITVPSDLDRHGLPLGIQIGTKPSQEKKLLKMAAWIEKQFGFSSGPA